MTWMLPSGRASSRRDGHGRSRRYKQLLRMFVGESYWPLGGGTRSTGHEDCVEEWPSCYCFPSFKGVYSPDGRLIPTPLGSGSRGPWILTSTGLLSKAERSQFLRRSLVLFVGVAWRAVSRNGSPCRYALTRADAGIGTVAQARQAFIDFCMDAEILAGVGVAVDKHGALLVADDVGNRYGAWCPMAVSALVAPRAASNSLHGLD